MRGRTGVSQAWERFWFTPVPTTSLAVLRIVYGLVLTSFTLTLGPDLKSFFFREGLFPEHPVRAWNPSLLRLFQSDTAVVVLYVVLLLSAVAITVGFRPQLASAVAWISMYSFVSRNGFVFNAGDNLLKIIALYLVFAPSGAALSLDRWRRHRSEFWDFPLRSPWALRLIQIQLSVIYLFTFVEKIRGDTWYFGTAVSYAQRLEYLQRFPLPDALANSLIFANLATYATLAIELAMAVLVWNRKARWWVIPLGLALHVLVDLTINVGFFSVLMFILYLAFVPPETMTRLALSLRNRWRQRRDAEAGEEEATASASSAE